MSDGEIKVKNINDYISLREYIEQEYLRPLLSISPTYINIFWDLDPKTIQVYLQAYGDTKKRQLEDMQTQSWLNGIAFINTLRSCPVMAYGMIESKDIKKLINKYPEQPIWVEQYQKQARKKIKVVEPTLEERQEYEQKLNKLI